MQKRLSPHQQALFDARRGKLGTMYDEEFKPLIRPFMRRRGTGRIVEGKKIILFLERLEAQNHVELVSYAEERLGRRGFVRFSNAIAPLVPRPRPRLISLPTGN